MERQRERRGANLDASAMLAREAGKNWQTNGNGGEMRRVFRSAMFASAASESRFGLGATGNGSWMVASPSRYNDGEFSGCVLR